MGDLGDLLLHLDRGGVADADSEQPQGLVAQFGSFARPRQLDRAPIDRRLVPDPPQVSLPVATSFVS